MWCSCNGLVLFNVQQHLLLWNPSIRCCTKVLELQHLRDCYSEVVSGLCYDSSTGDYKVVLLLDYEPKFVIVASLKNKQWREVPFPHNFNSASNGINFHGTLHWTASDIKLDDSDDSRDWERDNSPQCNKIVYFDVEYDEFRDFPTPEPTHVGVEDSIVGLGIVEGCFCMARKVKETKMIEVMVMEKYKMKESWVSKFVIPLSKLGNDYYYYGDMILYSLEKNSKVLIWSWQYICAYDLKKNKLNDFLEAPNGRHTFICFYVESFDSPNGFIWRDDQHNHFADTIKWKWMDG